MSMEVGSQVWAEVPFVGGVWTGGPYPILSHLYTPPLVAAKVLLGAVVYSWVVRGVFDLLFRVSVIMGSKVEGYPPPHMVSEFMLIKDTGLVVYS